MLWTRDSFITYLNETLIPDLIEAGLNATADDFRTSVEFVKQLPQSAWVDVDD